MADSRNRGPDGRGQRRHGGGRRPPPPEATGEEARYLARKRDAASPIVLRLIDGRMLRGRIESFDPHSIRLSCGGNTDLFVPKSEICYLFEEPSG